jgi:hypothetical protein
VSFCSFVQRDGAHLLLLRCCDLNEILLFRDLLVSRIELFQVDSLPVSFPFLYEQGRRRNVRLTSYRIDKHFVFMVKVRVCVMDSFFDPDSVHLVWTIEVEPERMGPISVTCATHIRYLSLSESTRNKYSGCRKLESSIILSSDGQSTLLKVVFSSNTRDCPSNRIIPFTLR